MNNNFTIEWPRIKKLSNISGVERMDQCRIVSGFATWMRDNPWKHGNQPRFDGSRRHQDTPTAEHCALYIGRKLYREGRRNQVAQVDFLVEDGTTVDLIGEFDSDYSPKKICGVIDAISRADNFTPSHYYGAEHARWIKNAVIILGILVPPGSQKCHELERMEFPNAIGPKIRAVRLCVGSSEAEILHKCKAAVRELMW